MDRLLVIGILIIFCLFLAWATVFLVFPWVTNQGGRFIGTEKGFCYDIDEGLSYYHSSIVYGRSSVGKEFREEDSCLDDKRLKEWRCLNLQPVSEVYECPRGCMGGACKI